MNTGKLAAADACRLDPKPRPARWLHHPSLPALDPADRHRRAAGSLRTSVRIRVDPCPECSAGSANRPFSCTIGAPRGAWETVPKLERVRRGCVGGLAGFAVEPCAWTAKAFKDPGVTVSCATGVRPRRLDAVRKSCQTCRYSSINAGSARRNSRSCFCA
jgi:hypothetical protein